MLRLNKLNESNKSNTSNAFILKLDEPYARSSDRPNPQSGHH